MSVIDAPPTLNVVSTRSVGGDVAALVRSLRMRADNVLVEIERPPARHGLLHLPDREHRAIDGVWARVLAVGPGHDAVCPRCGTVRRRIDTSVRPGARVLCEQGAVGDRWHIGGGEYRVVREAELLAVVDDGS